MTYWQFLVIFLVIPVVILLAITRAVDRRVALTLAGISVIALIYTAPWDNLIVVNGVWSYRPQRIVGVILGHVPLEEYLFYVLQVILTGTIAAALLRRRNPC
jgi:lycopene cyclase domain-containing protein